MERPILDTFGSVYNDISNALLSLYVSGKVKVNPEIVNILWTTDMHGKDGWMIYIRDLPQPHGEVTIEIGAFLYKLGYNIDLFEVVAYED